MKPEAAVQSVVMDYLNLIGWRVWRRNVGAMKLDAKRFVRFGVAGMADLEGIAKGGRHVEIEVKAPGKKPTLHQLAWLEQCRSQGAIALWCDSVDMLIEKLNEIARQS